MSKRNAVLVSVERDKKYSTDEKLIRRFIKLCKKERIREEYKDKLYFRTRTQKKREKKLRAIRRAKREADKLKQIQLKNQRISD